MYQAAPIPLPVLKQSNVKEAEEVQLEVEEEAAAFSELEPTSRLLITRKFETKKALTFKGIINNFEVKTPDDVQFYKVVELSKWTGYFCLGLRPFKLKVLDTNNEEIFKVKRSFACTSKVLPCQLQRAVVYTKDKFLGSIDQVWTALAPEYLVKDEEGIELYRITGSPYILGFFEDTIFRIEMMDGTSVGATCKRWRGLVHWLFKSPIEDYFGAAYDRELNTGHKVLLLAATFLIDYMYH